MCGDPVPQKEIFLAAIQHIAPLPMNTMIFFTKGCDNVARIVKTIGEEVSLKRGVVTSGLD